MFTLQVRKLFRKTLVFWSTTPQQPKHRPTRLGLEVLEDRTLLSVASLPVVSSPAESPLAVATSYMLALVEQRVQQFAAIVQYASNVVNTLNWEIVQEVAALQLQVGHILGIDTNTPNLASNAAASQPSGGSGTGQNHASGSGSGSGTATKAHDNTHPRLEDAVPLADSGSGSGSGAGAYSGSATVYGPVWLDNNADGSQEQANEEMDYSGATVYLDRSTDGGATWSVIDSTTTTSGVKYGNNYLLHAGFPVPVPNNWFYKVQVVFPPYCAATTPSAQSDINAQGYSQVFSLAPGAGQFIPAGLVSMNVNTTADDPNGPLQQNAVTLRDAILTGNKLMPFPAVTFNTLNPQTQQWVPLSGTITLKQALPSIQKSYNINGPVTSLSVDGNDDAGTVFTVNAGVTSTIKQLTITGGSGGNGGGVLNKGNLTLLTDNIWNNDATTDGGGVYNSSGAQLLLNEANISGNTAEGLGGGLANWGSVGISQVSVIQENVAGYGGGILNASGASIFATDGTTKIHDNTGNYNGGGVSNWGTFVMDSGSIYNNTAKGAGGGLANGGTMTLSATQGAPSGVQVYDNTASTGGGGGIYTFAGKLTLTRTTSIGDDNGPQPNKAPFGGGLYVNGGTAIVSGFIGGNVATSTSGGGIYVNAGKLTLDGAAVNGNTAPIGGAMYINGGTVKVTGASIYANLATLSGGGIYVNAGSLTMKGDYLLTENKAPSGPAGGMYIAGGKVSLSGGSIQGNTCSAAGGGIYNYAGSLTLNPAVYIKKNTAGTQGGGMYLKLGSTTSLVSLNMYNCVISGNLAQNQASGDGVYQQKIGDNAASLGPWTPGENVLDIDENWNGGIPVKGP